MSSERVRARLEDIRQNIALIRSFVETMRFEDFAADAKTIYAVTRALEIISEASRHLDDAVRAGIRTSTGSRSGMPETSTVTAMSW